MTETIIEDKRRPADPEQQIVAFDRRRPGRIEVSPVLVPLLRDGGDDVGFIEPSVPMADTPYRDFRDADPFHDQLAPARGIVLGLSISMLFWGAVGYAIFR